MIIVGDFFINISAKSNYNQKFVGGSHVNIAHIIITKVGVGTSGKYWRGKDRQIIHLTDKFTINTGRLSFTNKLRET